MENLNRVYIGVDNRIYKELINPCKITITKGEGRTEECNIPHTFDNWSDANSWLFSEALRLPRDSGYWKHDFKIEFPNGDSYSGRYDLMHASKDPCNLQRHVRGHLRWCADNGAQMGEHTAKAALAKLDEWQLDQGAVPYESDDAEDIAIVVADYSKSGIYA